MKKAARIVVRAVVDRALPTAARRLKHSHRVRKESPTATVHNDKLHAKPVYPLLPLTLSSGRTWGSSASRNPKHSNWPVITSLLVSTGVVSCCDVTLLPWTSSGSQMKSRSLSQLRRTLKTIEFTYLLGFVRRMLSHPAYCEHGQPSPNHWWCQLVCRLLDAGTYTLWIPAWKSMGNIIVTSCCAETSFRIFDNSQTFTRFSKMAHRCTELARHQTLPLLVYGHPTALISTR